MYDDANPLAMGSGLVLGLGIGAFVMLGAPAWRDAAAKMCQLAAAESGLGTEVGCGSRTAGDAPAMASATRVAPRR